MAARLSHPNVLGVYDIAEEDGRPWLVMELVPHCSLRDAIAADGPLSPGLRRAGGAGHPGGAARGAPGWRPALYWSVPESSWNADYHYFQAYAATFRPAGVNQG